MQKGSSQMKEKIQSAKVWLDKAEQSYANDADTKGYLQLMVARAEMQHLSERTPFWMTKTGIFTIAVGLVTLISVSLWGYTRYVEFNTPPQLSPLEIETSRSSAPVKDEKTPVVAPMDVPEKEPAVVVNTHSEEIVSPRDVPSGDRAPVVIESKEVAPVVASPPPVMTSQEIQQAVRDGSRSLRE